MPAVASTGRNHAHAGGGLASRVRSYDVFDTLITRLVGRPKDLFVLLGLRLDAEGLLPGVSPAAFARARVDAEKRAWHQAGGRDSHVRLEDIYTELLTGLGFPAEGLAALVEQEIALERACLRPNAAVAADLARERRAGHRVAVLSDTYFPQAVLRQLLAGCGVHVNRDELLSSTTEGAAKATGSLYRLLATRLGVPPSALVHSGDDPRSDIEAARRVGVSVRPFRDGSANRFELRLADEAQATDGFSSLLAGASRQARLAAVEDGMQPALAAVAAGVAAPMLVGYSLWVLHQIRRRGIQRTFFLSRDGQVLLELCRRMAPRLGMADADLRYLHVSRRAVNLPLLGEAPAAPAGAWLWTRLRDVSAADLVAAAGLPPKEAAPRLTELGVDLADALGPGQRQRVVDDLRHGKLAEAVGRRASASAPLVREHLCERGFLDPHPTAAVDLGGFGSQYQALALARRAAGVPPAHGLYAYLDARPETPPPLHPGQESAWLYDRRQGLGWPAFPGLVPLLESAAAADHGTVLGYERRDGVVHPVLETGRTRQLRGWDLEGVRRVLLQVADELPLEEDFARSDADVRAAVLAVAEELWRHPTRAEAQAWGAHPYRPGPAAAAAAPLAQPYSAAEALRAAQRSEQPGSWWRWQAGSLALTPAPLRVAVRSAGRVRAAARTAQKAAAMTLPRSIRGSRRP